MGNLGVTELLIIATIFGICCLIPEVFFILTLQKALYKRNISVEPLPGKNIGLAWCILVVCCLVPLLGIVAGILAIICWILYWVKIAGLSSTLAASPVNIAMQVPA